ncbi:thioredoxin family protein [Thalassotalea eurytherma]|uniref:Thioredoxin n=1 Tax=Thalassotalea eurytherma TaxID=1144278 RepID=A0ABQ6H6W6_9GAMM|nr:thioredoxin family protein [Thalassotalea eurytherma]GLX82495.1 hypothetical protein theurythT_19470 [Thalassotalea eurytherma]
MYKHFLSSSLALLLSIFASFTYAGSGHDHDFPVGVITKQQVLENAGFAISYNGFELNERDLELSQYWGKNVRVEVYFGMWCHDSEREVPRLIKVLDNQPDVKLSLFALDIKKQDPEGIAKAKGVKYTPTIIVYMDNQEVGRIIERPDVSLTEDIQQMLAK